MLRLGLWPGSRSHQLTSDPVFNMNDRHTMSWWLCFFPLCLLALLCQVLLELSRSLPSGGRAALPGPGVVLSESSAGPPEERRQSDVAARLWSLLLLLPGEPQVRRPLLSHRLGLLIVETDHLIVWQMPLDQKWLSFRLLILCVSCISCIVFVSTVDLCL